MSDRLKMKTAALAYADLGLRIFPLVWNGYDEDDTKIVGTPLVKWKDAATSDRHTIAKWWSRWPLAGIGLATGDELGSGGTLFVIDLDRHDPAADGIDLWHELAAGHDVPAGPESITGGGGLHLFFKSSTKVVTNARGSLPRGIDVRGRGGYVVLPPSSHKSGGSYEWEHSSTLGEIPIPEAPAFLLDLLVEPEREERTSKPSEPYASVWDTIDDRPGSDWADRTSWSSILEADGWSFFGYGSDGEEQWTRPGKEPRDGWSATLNYKGTGLLYNFSSNAPAGLPVEETVSKLGYLAATKFGGLDRASFSAAAKSVRQISTDNGTNMSSGERNTTTIDRLTGQALPVHEVDENGELDEEDDWKPVDIAEIARKILANEYEPELPTLLEVHGSTNSLLYPGRTHVVFGPPGGGKTWIALQAIAERLKLDEDVLFVDFEDSAQGTAQRLLRLGVDVEQLSRFDYRTVSTSLAYGWETLESSTKPYSLIVIDSTGEALAAQGVNPNDDGEVAVWMALVKRLSQRPSGPAVLLLDHVPKNSENPHAAPIGSQRKLAAVSGAAYRCDTKTEPARGKAGLLKLTTTKDRLGHRAKGLAAALVEIEDVLGGDYDGIRIHLRVETGDDREATVEQGQEVVLALRISEFLEGAPGNVSPNAVRQGVRGGYGDVMKGIDFLVDLGHVRRDPAPGRKGEVLNLLRPYTGDDDPADHKFEESSLTSPSRPDRSMDDRDDRDVESSVTSVPLRGDGTDDRPDRAEESGIF